MRRINDRFRYRHATEIGVHADYCILQFRFAETGWQTVGTFNSSWADTFHSHAADFRNWLKQNTHAVKFIHPTN